MRLPPAYVTQIGTTNACNARCSFCFQGQNTLTKKRGVMSLELFKRIINDNPGTAYNLCLYGEPLLDKGIVDKVRFCDGRVYFHTNGQLLTKKMVDDLRDAGLNELIISCTGLGDTHKGLMPGVDFDTVVENATYAVTQMKTSIFSCIDGPGRKAATKFWEERGVGVLFDTMKRWGDGVTQGGGVSGHSCCAVVEGYRVYDWDGSMLLCCLDFNGLNKFGDANTETYSGASARIPTMDTPFCEGCPHKGSFDAFRSGK